MLFPFGISPLPTVFGMRSCKMAVFKSEISAVYAQNRKALMAVGVGDLLRCGPGSKGVNGGLRLIVEVEKQEAVFLLTLVLGCEVQRDPIDTFYQDLTEIIHRNDPEWPDAILEFFKIDPSKLASAYHDAYHTQK